MMVAVFAALAMAFAPDPPALTLQADGHPRDVEQWTTEPEFRGKRAQCPLPLDQVVENTVDRGNNGLCVPSSGAGILNYQGRPDIGRYMLELASADDNGGFTIDTYETLLRKVQERFPELRWTQYEGRSLDFAKKWNRLGYALQITYGTGRPYGMKPIAHKVILNHIDDRWASIIDNNFIYRGAGGDSRGRAYVWLPEPELLRRACMWGNLWNTVFTNPGLPMTPGNLPWWVFPAILGLGIVALADVAILGAGFFMFVGRK